ncbi:MAG: T9SS type A sorting domain-containing protein [Crocinitomicaceae bacterium]|nr:T9SS type A sorting domain-containing protein [Crocinitomicaceae bacterium]
MVRLVKYALVGLIFIVPFIGNSQSYATAAAPVDCDGITHDLFAELDAGKVIVIGWTMPCATCAGPLLQVHNSVLNFAVTNPGEVEYWMTDDFANTSCATIEAWSNSNGISNAFFFSSSELSMYDYGSAGMPKVVVVGCTDHRVYYNVNDSPTGIGARNAIDNALTDIAAGCLTSVDNLESAFTEMKCFPNPASTEVKLSFTAEPNQQLKVEVINLAGAILYDAMISNLNESNVEINIDVQSFNDGMYFLKISNAEVSEVIKVQIQK